MLENQGFNPILPNSPFGADFFLLCTAGIIVMLHPNLAGSADTHHHRTAFAAKQLAEQQIVHLRLFVGGSLLIVGKQLLHLVEKLGIDNRGHGIVYADFTVVFVGAHIFFVFQHSVQAVLGEFVAPLSSQSPVIQFLDDLGDGFSFGIQIEDQLHSGCLLGIDYILLIFVNGIP